ncbi:MAG: TIGR02281 family clan AA aspartic protease [Sphingomicrobium sp.]
MASSLKQVAPGPADSARFAEVPESPVTVSEPGDTSRSAPSVASYTGAGLVLKRHGDGHFYANVEINGATIEMLIDTGASGVALSENDARRIGIATSIGMRDHIGEGAGGAVYGDVVQLNRVRLGDVELDQVQAVVLKGGNMSLLGQSFLAKFGKVEIEGDRMFLRS